MTKKTQKVYEISRYGDQRYITDVGGGCYIIEGKSKFIRAGGDDMIEYVDFEGGPFIGVGSPLFEDNSKIVVESIKFENSNKEDWVKISVSVVES
jgi:hypothetical protein